MYTIKSAINWRADAGDAPLRRHIYRNLCAAADAAVVYSVIVAFLFRDDGTALWGEGEAEGQLASRYICIFFFGIIWKEAESARERVAMAIFLFYSLSSSPLSADAPPSALWALSVCVWCLKLYLMLTHVIAAASAAAQPRHQPLHRQPAPAQRFGSPNYCQFAITLFLWCCGGEDGMNGALVLSLSGSDGQIELRALILSYEAFKRLNAACWYYLN